MNEKSEEVNAGENKKRIEKIRIEKMGEEQQSYDQILNEQRCASINENDYPYPTMPRTGCKYISIIVCQWSGDENQSERIKAAHAP